MKIKEVINEDFELVFRPIAKSRKELKPMKIPINLMGNIKVIEKAEGDRIIAGYANIAVVDSENQLIPIESLRKGLETLMSDPAYSNLMLVHKNIQIGKILDKYEELETHVDDKGLFLVCLAPETEVRTGKGLKPICEVNVGDNVLTHLGGYAYPVTATMKRKFKGNIKKIYLSNTEEIRVTGNHPILTKEGWKRADELVKNDILLRLSDTFENHDEWLKKKREHAANTILTPESRENLRNTKKNWNNDRPYYHSDGYHEYKSDCATKAGEYRVGKTYEELYGEDRAEKIKKKQRKFTVKISTRRYHKEVNRETVLESVSYTCEECGTSYEHYKRYLLVHHKDNDFTNNSRDNLQVLCYKCHAGTYKHTAFTGKGTNSREVALKEYHKRLIHDIGMCQICRTTENLIIHHTCDSEEPKDLVVLCKPCHQKVHNNPDALIMNGTIVRWIEDETYDGYVYNLEIDKANSYAGKGLIYHNCQLRKDIKIADKVWQQILDGEYNGFSIGCEVIGEPKSQCDVNGENCIEVLDDINIFEVSVCIPPTQKIQCNPTEKEIQNISVGDLVLTHKGNYKPVVRKYVREYNDELINIRPRFTSDVFKLTPNHPVLIAETSYCKKYKCWADRHKVCSPNCGRDDCEIRPIEFSRKWIPAGKLSKKNHLLAFPINKKILSNEEILNHWNDDWISIRNYRNGGLKKEQLLNKDFWRLVGYWLAEGSISKYKNRYGTIFYPGKHEIDNIRDIKKLITRIINRKYYGRDTQSNAHSIDFSDKASFNFLKQFKSNPYRYGQKRIPRWVEELPLEFQRELILGYFRGDKFTSVSKQMIKSIQRILLRFRILISMGKNNEEGIGSFQDRLVNIQDSWTLGTEKSSLRNLLGLDLIHSYKENHLEKWDNDYVYIPISNIEREKYIGNVMNLEVADDNSYGNSLVMVHNCNSPVNEMSGFVVVSKSKYENGDFLNNSNVCNECDDNKVEMTKKAVKSEVIEEDTKEETPKAEDETKSDSETIEETKDETTEELSVDDRIQNIERLISNVEAVLSKLMETEEEKPEEKSDEDKEASGEEEKTEEKLPEEEKSSEEQTEGVEKEAESEPETPDWKKSYDELKSVVEGFAENVSKSIGELTSIIKEREEKSEVEELEMAMKARDDKIEALEKKVKIYEKAKDKENEEIIQKTVQEDTSSGEDKLTDDDDESLYVFSKGSISRKQFM